MTTTKHTVNDRISKSEHLKNKLHLKCNDHAEKALRVILKKQLSDIQTNYQGVIDDQDIECLHNFRVAIRRSRSAISQLKKVFNKSSVSYFQTEMRWVGDVTTLCRDLDIFLLQMEKYFHDKIIPGSENLQPLITELQTERKQAQSSIVECLKSLRYQQLISNWKILINHPQPHFPECPNATVPIKEVSSQRILIIYQRIVHRGNELGTKPPASEMHRLRIDGKKLRYLLEFFRDIYPKSKIDLFIDDLKNFQDILGGFQDMEVQHQRLDSFSKSHPEILSKNTEFSLYLNKLDTIILSRQEEYRLQFQSKFQPFASNMSQAEYICLFGEIELI